MPDGPAVDAARLRLETRDQLHRADLGGADDRTRRKDAPQQPGHADVRFERRANAGRHLVQGLERLHSEKVGDADAADLGDAADVVAHQVDDHQIFRALLHVGRELPPRLRIGFDRTGTRRGAFHGPRRDDAALLLDE